MKIQYFQDTDTLYIEFNTQHVAETRDLDDNTLVDLDAEGRVCALTLEQTSLRANLPHIEMLGVAA